MRGPLWSPSSGDGIPGRVIASALLFVALQILPSLLEAQTSTYWVGPTTFGFGGLGCWTGYLAGTELVREAEDSGQTGPSVAVGAIAGCVAGILAGKAIGSQADSLLDEGQELPEGLRRGVKLGIVLSGATAGSLVGMLFATSQEGRKTRTVSLFALGGAVGGFVLQATMGKGPHPERNPAKPLLGRAPGGELIVGLELAYRF